MMNPIEEKILGKSWAEALGPIFSQQQMVLLKDFLKKEYASFNIYPAAEDVFKAYRLTPYEDVKVVFIGQDPYHGPGQAEGLCFSVPASMKTLPPSLKNLFTELSTSLNRPAPISGHLGTWAQQGIFLINSTLTVRAHEPLSHQHPGWDYFFQETLKALNAKKEPVLFVLLGAHAQKYSFLMTQSHHQVFKAPHPSPLSAYRGFFGSGLFLTIEKFLNETYACGIDWG